MDDLEDGPYLYYVTETTSMPGIIVEILGGHIAFVGEEGFRKMPTKGMFVPLIAHFEEVIFLCDSEDAGRGDA